MPKKPKPQKPARKPNPASASNGKTGGRPRTITPAPDALRESARILRAYIAEYGSPTGTLGTYLEPVAAMLDRMAKGVRPEKAITTPQTVAESRLAQIANTLDPHALHDAFRAIGLESEARASIALDKDPDCQTLIGYRKAYPGVPS